MLGSLILFMILSRLGVLLFIAKEAGRNDLGQKMVNDFEEFGFKVVATHSEVTGYSTNVKSKLCITMRKSDQST